jgi:hypothetical protein
MKLRSRLLGLLLAACGPACGDTTVDAARDDGGTSSDAATPRPSPCQQHATQEACCEDQCYWLPGQSGVPARCIAETEDCAQGRARCPSGQVCYDRGYSCGGPGCVSYYSYCDDSHGICVAQCPPDSEPYTQENGQVSCWGGKGAD